MSTSLEIPTAAPPTTPPTGPPSLRRFEPSRLLRASAGPVMIAGLTLFLMKDFWLHLLVAQHPDDLSFWLPNYCFLGRSLASGHIPLWNPYTLGGVPFAADPQTGWMYLPAMALFSTLSCGRAFVWFISLQPVLAGLGMYWFLRGEEASRTAATVAGLAIALPVAASGLSLSLPFAGTIAWTCITLGAASRLMQAERWSRRLIWVAVVALAWGQVAAAHLSYGVFLATGALVAYLIAKVVSDVRVGRRSNGGGVALLLLVLAALPAVNLGYLLPRMLYLPHTTLGVGYERLETLTRSFTGSGAGAVTVGGLQPDRVLGFGVSPGLYLGAIALALSFAGFFSRRHRAVVIGIAAYGAMCYLLSLHATAEQLQPHLVGSSVGSMYLHEPQWISYGLVIAIPALAGFGVEAWRNAPGARDRILMLVPAIVAWWALPLFVGSAGGYTPLFASGTVAATVTLLLVAWRPPLAPMIAVVVAFELMINASIGFHGAPAPRDAQLLAARRTPKIDVNRFLSEGPIARAITLAPGRYLSLSPGDWKPIGYHVLQFQGYWPFLAMQQSITDRLDAAQGYNPIQPIGYWEFVRAADPKRIKYNASYFVRASPITINLLRVSDVISRTDVPPPAGASPITTSGAWTLYRVVRPAPLASAVTGWRIVPSIEASVRAVTAQGFDPSSDVIVQRPPGLPSPQPGTAPMSPGSVTATDEGTQGTTLMLTAPVPALVLVRVPYDPGWHATVDGRPAPVLRADGFLQAVPVGAGTHTIVLRYTDPAIGLGLLGSAIALILLLGGAAVLARGERRSRERDAGPGANRPTAGSAA